MSKDYFKNKGRSGNHCFQLHAGSIHGLVWFPDWEQQAPVANWENDILYN